MAKILKQVRCGRLVCAVAYTAPAAGDSPRARAQKQKASTAARERLNARTSFQKLERTLAANFDNGDLFVTLTYDNKHLPEDRDGAVRRIRTFFPKLRKARQARGEPLRYVYVTEGWPSRSRRRLRCRTCSPSPRRPRRWRSPRRGPWSTATGSGAGSSTCCHIIPAAAGPEPGGGGKRNSFS